MLLYTIRSYDFSITLFFKETIMSAKIEPIIPCEIFWINDGTVIRIAIDDEECLTPQELKALKPNSYDEFHEIIYGF